MLSKYLEDEKYYVIITMGKLLSIHVAAITTRTVELNFNLKDVCYEHANVDLVPPCFFSFKSCEHVKKNDKPVNLTFSKTGRGHPRPAEYNAGLPRAAGV